LLKSLKISEENAARRPLMGLPSRIRTIAGDILSKRLSQDRHAREHQAEHLRVSAPSATRTPATHGAGGQQETNESIAMLTTSLKNARLSQSRGTQNVR